MDWHARKVEDILQEYGVEEEGLNSSEVTKRQKESGLNEIEGRQGRSVVAIFVGQFFNPLIVILFVAAILKLFVASILDGTVILVTIGLMVGIAFFQEVKAEKALIALKKMAAPKAKVKREGSVEEILSKECVPGDIVLLEAGSRVPADCRLMKVSNLQVNDASLTGESIPVEKMTDPLAQETELAERKNMVYAGTVVSHGKGVAVACATGMSTELGKIAKQLQSTHKELTPLQKGIKRLGNWMLLVIGGIILGFLALGWSIGMGWLELFLLCVAIAVAAIPEGLPATVTVVLASGVHHLSKKKGIIRKLVAVETLGSTTVICTDKTGTLTENAMTLVEWATLKGQFPIENESVEREKLLKIGALCNDAVLKEDKEIGDSTEIALLKGLKEINEKKEAWEKETPRVDEIPFSSEKQWMATLHAEKEGPRALIKGAPEKLLAFSSQVEVEGRVQPLSDKERSTIEGMLHEMAKKGLRILGMAYKDCSESDFNEGGIEQGLTFIGCLGFIDPPRKEVKEAIKKCQQAGITVKMVTGDNPQTAEAIGKELELSSKGVVTGRELESYEDNILEEKLKEIHIFARIEPGHKLRIVEACKKRGDIVGMTGDGVNDAPALEAANIGISMGITGTDVTKEASDIILADDNFSTIVDCVDEGRAIFNRLRHVTTFLMTTCFGEVATILFAFLFFQTSPLEPLQILWINLVTGSLVAIPIGMEPKEGNELQYPPRSHQVGLVFPGMVWRIGFLSLALSIGAFLVFSFSLNTSNLTHARSMTFCSIVLFEWFISFHMRSDERSVRSLGFLRNKMLILSSIIAVCLLGMILYIPFFQKSFMTTFLTFQDWLICLTPGLVVFFLESLRKKLFPKLFNYGKWKIGQ
ncbi:MAG: HAD-IC family P-type ATPase [Chlamydiia bacterium]|nr:HAD-IC family P-type ATPase [Chlamydiia bacterium]